MVSELTTVKQLFNLQALDMEIVQCHSSISSVVGELGDRVGLDALHKEVETQTVHLKELRVQQKSRELDAKSVREKLKDVEAKLYSGQITNLREMEGYEKEATILRNQLGVLEENHLESMMILEEAQERLRTMKKSLDQAEGQWRKRQDELAEEQKRLEKTLANLEASRSGLTSGVGPQELKAYENIRLSRGGLAIAKVERGMCRACSMALPTHQLQRARKGRELVMCSSCGRILFVS